MSTQSNSKSIIKQSGASTSGKARVDFVKGDFDAAVEQKGYSVYLDKAIKCPCANIPDRSAIPSCRNCGGVGWAFINRIETKMILQSMSQSFEYKAWTEESIGNIKITAREESQLSFMDRITIIDANSILNQLIFPKNENAKVSDPESWTSIEESSLRGKTSYDIKQVLEVFAFQGTEIAYRRLEEGVDFYVPENSNTIFFNREFFGWENFTISIRYKHAPSYHLLELARDIISTTIRDSKGYDKVVTLPVHGVGKKAHYMLDEDSYNGTYLIDNSYIPSCATVKENNCPPVLIYKNDEPPFAVVKEYRYNTVCLGSNISANSINIRKVDSGSDLDLIVKRVNGDIVDVTIEDDSIVVPDIITCEDATVQLNGVFNQTVEAGGTANVIVDNSVITVEGAAFQSLVPEQDLDIEVEYQTQPESPIHSIVGNKIIITDAVVIPTSKIYLRPIGTGEVYVPADPLFPDGCDSWQVVNNIDPFTQPTNGIPMLLDKSNPTQLIPDNIFNSKRRFTCPLTGGYVDFETGTYHLVDGTTVTQAEAFPLGLFLDHHTGLRWTNGQIGMTNYTWYDSLTLVEGHSQGGYDDYHVPDQKKMDSIFNLNYQATFGSSGDKSPLFTTNITNGNKWTSSTIKGQETRAWAYGVNGASSSGNLKTGIMRVIGFAFHF